MIMFGCYILILFTFGAMAEETQPFEPSMAADQPVVRFETMYREMNQFSYFGSWARQRSDLINKREDCVEAGEALARVRKTLGKTTTEADFETAEYKLNLCQAEAEQIEKSIDYARARAAAEKLLVQQMGQPDDDTADYRRDIAEQLKSQVDFEGEQLRITAKINELRRKHLEARLVRSNRLCREKVMTPVECATIRRDYDSIVEIQKGLRAQAENNQKASAGMKRSIERLFSEG